MQFLQGEEGPAGAQPQLLAAIDALQALHQELDVADAPAVELHVQAGGLGRSLPAAVRADLFPRIQRGLDGREIQLRPVHARQDAAQELARQRQVPGRVPRLDHGLQLPVVRHFRVVAQGPAQAHGGFALAALGAQPQVDAEDRALARHPRQQLRGLLRQPDEVFPVGNLRRAGRLAVAVQEHQVHVRAVVQFVAAQFAQGEHGKGRLHQPPLRVVVAGRAVTLAQSGVGLAQRFRDEHVRERRDLSRDFGQGSDAQHVAQHDAHVLAALEARQGQRRVRLEGAGAEACQALLEVLARVRAVQVLLPRELLQQVRVLDQGLAQELAVGEDRQRVVDESAVPVQQPQALFASLLAQFLEEVESGIGVGRAGEQRGQRLHDPARGAAGDALQVARRRLRIAERDVRNRRCLVHWGLRGLSIARGSGVLALAWSRRV